MREKPNVFGLFRVLSNFDFSQSYEKMRAEQKEFFLFLLPLQPNFRSTMDMKHQFGTYIIMVVATFFAMAGCSGGGTSNKYAPQANDTLYTWKAAMQERCHHP